MIDRKILPEVHAFPEVDRSVVPVGRGGVCPKEWFNAGLRTEKSKLKAIMTGGAVPSWNSPGPSMVQAPHAVQILLEELRQQQRLELAGSAWLCSPLRSGQLMIKPAALKESPWYLVLGDVCSTLLVGWPLVSCCRGSTYYRPQLECQDRCCFKLLAIVRLDDGLARTYSVVLPATRSWELHQHGEPCAPVDVSGMMVRASDLVPLCTCLASNAFFEVPLATLRELATHLSMPDPSGESLCDLLSEICGEVLKDPLKVAAALQKRAVSQEDPLAEHFNDFEPVLDCVDQDETEEMQQGTIKHKQSIASKAEFAAQVRATSKRLLNIGHRAGELEEPQVMLVWLQAPPPPAIPEGAITQSQAKAMIPPGSFIWQGRMGTWQSHSPPHRRFSRSWAGGGHREAALAAIRDAWSKYLQDNHLRADQCPVPGFFQASVSGTT